MLQSTKRKSYTKIDTSWKASYINSIQFFILSRRCKSDGCYVYHSHRGPFFQCQQIPSQLIDLFRFFTIPIYLFHLFAVLFLMYYSYVWGDPILHWLMFTFRSDTMPFFVHIFRIFFHFFYFFYFFIFFYANSLWSFQHLMCMLMMKYCE